MRCHQSFGFTYRVPEYSPDLPELFLPPSLQTVLCTWMGMASKKNCIYIVAWDGLDETKAHELSRRSKILAPLPLRV